MQYSIRKIVIFLLFGLAYAFSVIAIGRTSEVYYDSKQYFDYACNLLQSGVYGLIPGTPDMGREPGYGIYLSGLFSLIRGIGFAPDLASIARPENIFWVKMLQAFVLFCCAGITAFLGALPKRIRWAFFLILIFSPSTISAMRELYSEALAIPLAVLWIYFVSKALQGNCPLPFLGVGIIQALLVLTKSYLYYASFLFLLIALAFALRRKWRPIFYVSLAIATGGFVAQKGWNYRNSTMLGQNAHEPRLSLMLAGKIARIDTVNLGEDLSVALAASIGTNFCDRHFGMDRCKNFDYRGSDQKGYETLVRYWERKESGAMVDQMLRRDMLRLYFQKPFTQIFGSGLEILRMFFFESVLDTGTLPRPLQPLGRAWHVAGSLLLWLLILVSWCHFFNAWATFAEAERGLILLCSSLPLFHVITMAQITNVVRYIFPVLPFFYFFAAFGLAQLFTWRARCMPAIKGMLPSNCE